MSLRCQGLEKGRRGRNPVLPPADLPLPPPPNPLQSYMCCFVVVVLSKMKIKGHFEEVV